MRISLIQHNSDIIVESIPVNALVEAIDIVPTIVDFVGREERSLLLLTCMQNLSAFRTIDSWKLLPAV